MAKGRSYLYVIGPDPQDVHDPWVKIGRSNDPKSRRSQLQVGQGETLAVRGAFLVPAELASERETAAKAFLTPIKIKGEVFHCRHEVACAFAEQFATHGQPDEFLGLLLADTLASNKAWRLASRGSRIPAGLEAADAEATQANDALFAFDFERAAKTDEIMGDIRRPKTAIELAPLRTLGASGKRILTPRQPRTGPSLFKRRGATA